MTIPVVDKELAVETGFHPSVELNYMDENLILALQKPFIIGLLHTIPTEVIYEKASQCISPMFSTLLKTGIEEDCSFDQLLEVLKSQTTKASLYKLAKKIYNFDITNSAETNRVDIIHLNQNELPDKQEEPSEESIQNLVNKFIFKLFDYGKLIKIIKYLLLEDIKCTIENIIEETREINKSYQKCIFNKLLFSLKRFIEEHFLISFNGAKYDIHLIINQLYKFSIINKKCTIRTFRKGSTITNLTMNWNEGPWSQTFTMKDLRNLTEQSVSLDLLGKKFGIPANCQKGTFPHSRNSSVRYVLFLSLEKYM